MMHPLHAAEGRRDFTVRLMFLSGHEGVVDLSGFVGRGEVTAPLRADPDLFVSSLRVLPDGDGIGWPGDVDIDADALWYKLFPEDWERDFGSRDRRTG